MFHLVIDMCCSNSVKKQYDVSDTWQECECLSNAYELTNLIWYLVSFIFVRDNAYRSWQDATQYCYRQMTTTDHNRTLWRLKRLFLLIPIPWVGCESQPEVGSLLGLMSFRTIKFYVFVDKAGCCLWGTIEPPPPTANVDITYSKRPHHPQQTSPSSAAIVPITHNPHPHPHPHTNTFNQDRTWIRFGLWLNICQTIPCCTNIICAEWNCLTDVINDLYTTLHNINQYSTYLNNHQPTQHQYQQQNQHAALSTISTTNYKSNTNITTLD